MLHKKRSKDDTFVTSIFGSKEESQPVPKNKLPEGSMLPKIAYQIVHDECMMDGNARLNLATFVTTWLEDEGIRLMKETMDKNMIDKSEYPQTAEIEKRCVNIIGNLWNVQDEHSMIGCSTLGSSEGCMLGGLALKWRWRERQKKNGKSIGNPNLVINSGFQVVWEKFCKYWDIEMREVPMEKGYYRLDVEKAIALCDENTIGIVPTMGVTYTGLYDDVKSLNDALEKYNQRTGYNIPMHVDAASGGFVAPFLQPEIEWDFRLKWVHSINASGHKYGLVYPGVGWVIWKEEEFLPKDLIFYVDYLGGEIPTLALNFSRPGNQVLAQYYLFLRLGFEGFYSIQNNSQKVAMYLSNALAKMDLFELLSEGSDIPVFCWTLKGEQKNWTLYDLADKLRMDGWQVPAYRMPKNVQDMIVMRIVVKQDMNHDMADILLDHIRKHLNELKALKAPTPSALKRDSGEQIKTRFHH